MAPKEGVTMRAALTLAVASMLVASTMTTTAFADSQTTRIQIRYEPPKDPEHGQIYEDLKRLRALEKLQEFLSPFRLPRTLTIMLAGCDGEADAFYGDDEITICYEYVDVLWKNMPAQTTPGGVAPIDTVFGPLFDTSLHEFAHALFGREEDAADQVAAYIYLQFGAAESRRLIMGTVYAYATEALKGELPSSLEEVADVIRAERPRSLEEFAGEHSTPAQRAYNPAERASRVLPRRIRTGSARLSSVGGPPHRPGSGKGDLRQDLAGRALEQTAALASLDGMSLAMYFKGLSWIRRQQAAIPGTTGSTGQ
jgi:hypothetical protein